MTKQFITGFLTAILVIAAIGAGVHALDTPAPDPNAESTAQKEALRNQYSADLSAEEKELRNFFMMQRIHNQYEAGNITYRQAVNKYEKIKVY